MNALPIIIGSLCLIAISYRYYSAFIAAKVLALDDSRPVPSQTMYDGHNYYPTNKWVLFGHHFAAISGAGPLIGPVLAAQFGFLPGLLWLVIGVCIGGAVHDFMNLKKLPVHRAMREISELIYETCKTYLVTQGKFILILEAFIAVIIILYFGVLSGFSAGRVSIILAFSLVGIAGSYGVAWFGIRVNTFANSRTAFASLEGKPFPLYAIPLKAGMRARRIVRVVLTCYRTARRICHFKMLLLMLRLRHLSFVR